jgi:hypothetical protein
VGRPRHGGLLRESEDCGQVAAGVREAHDKSSSWSPPPTVRRRMCLATVNIEPAQRSLVLFLFLGILLLHRYRAAGFEAPLKMK